MKKYLWLTLLCVGLAISATFKGYWFNGVLILFVPAIVYLFDVMSKEFKKVGESLPEE